MAKERFCLRGHDKEALGRDSRGSCKECKRGKEANPELREKRNIAHRDRRISNIGIRYQLLVDNARQARKRIEASGARLDRIFAEVNEVLAG